MDILAAIVSTLILGMGSPHYNEREACQSALSVLNIKYDLRAILYKFQTNDPEILARIEKIKDSYNDLGLIDVPALVYIDVKWAYWEYDEKLIVEAIKKGGYKYDDDVDYTYASQRMATYIYIKLCLDRMRFTRQQLKKDLIVALYEQRN